MPQNFAPVAILVVTLLLGACTACGGRLVLGVPPWAVGVRGSINADVVEVGVEAGGWLVGVGAYLDVGPLEEPDAEADSR